MVPAVTSTLSLYYSEEEGGVMMERLPQYLLTPATTEKIPPGRHYIES